MQRLAMASIPLLAAGASVFFACGSTATEPPPGAQPEPHGDASSVATDKGDGGSVATPPSFGGVDAATCVGLKCQQVACPNGGTTSVSGTVHAATPPQYGPPDPVYNAIVYVPNAPLAPFTPGVSCDKCGAPASGDPVVTALSSFDGKFSLTNVPVGKDIPIVIQVGRWRRRVTIPEVTKCVDTPLDAELTRLPRNQKEGDIPLTAIASSTYDPEECILRKMGIDDSEFTGPAQGGRVHIFTATGAAAAKKTKASALWASAAALKAYDVVLLPCDSVPTSDATYAAAVEYTAAGGRVFATDLSYPWVHSAPAPFPGTATWVPWSTVDADPLPATIDQTFPKGDALAKWLKYVGATPTEGHIDLHETYHVVDAVNAPTQRWLYSTSPATLQTFSFNTPVGAMPEDQCGRVVYSNFHIASAGGGATTYPDECSPEPLTPQERVMEFMLFDLASCVQKDAEPPKPPDPR